MDCKACTKCGEVKALDAFYAEKRNANGRAGACKCCSNAVTAAWRAAHPDRINSTAKRWREQNLERARQWVRDANRAKRLADPDFCRAVVRAWSLANPEAGRRRSKRQQARLAPAYVADCLRIPVADLTPELLALKREQLELHRLSKQIKNHLKDQK